MDVNKKIEVNKAFIAKWQSTNASGIWEPEHIKITMTKSQIKMLGDPLWSHLEWVVRNVKNHLPFSSKYILKERETISISKNYIRHVIKFVSLSVAYAKTQNR